MEALTVQVTEDHIRRGSRKYYGYDPIALAIMDMGATSAAAGWGYFSLVYEGNTIKGDITNKDEVTSWIKNWDQGRPVSPITVSLLATSRILPVVESDRKPPRVRSYYDQARFREKRPVSAVFRQREDAEKV